MGEEDSRINNIWSPGTLFQTQGIPEGLEAGSIFNEVRRDGQPVMATGLSHQAQDGRAIENETRMANGGKG